MLHHAYYLFLEPDLTEYAQLVQMLLYLGVLDEAIRQAELQRGVALSSSCWPPSAAVASDSRARSERLLFLVVRMIVVVFVVKQ